ncbi:MAG: hypothetical protein JXA41_04430 [Deltaproteobacteria bacterium]|nr:hypothetical protein [Deltaproteobacteria bacterium]
MSMKKSRLWCLIIALFLFVVLTVPEPGFSWSPKAHTLIAQKAGMQNPAYSFFPDLFKEENKALLGPLHYHNAAPQTTVTPAYIDRYPIRLKDYVPAGRMDVKPITIRVPHPAGVLYWKIVELYEAMKGKTGWLYDYYLFSIAHYIGDLSQPLHNFPHGNKRAGDGRIYQAAGNWAKEHHKAFDEILESLVPLDQEMDTLYDSWIHEPCVKSAGDLKREIARIANASIALANKCYAEKRLITVEEALRHTALSVSLLKAVIADTQKGPPDPSGPSSE